MPIFTPDIDPERIDDENDRVPSGNSVDNEGAKRLQEAVYIGGGPTEVARRSGIPLGTLRNYLRGRDMKRAALVSLASATGVTLEWLAAGSGPVTTAPERDGEEEPVTRADLAPPGFVAIPRYNVEASAGGGALVNHPQIVEYFAFDERYLRMHLRRRPEHLLLIDVVGDSMQPTLRDGDIVTVDISPDQTLEHSKLYVLRVGDNLLVKRVEQRLNSIVLHSDNPRYEPETIARTDIDQLHILGQVILVSAPPR